MKIGKICYRNYNIALMRGRSVLILSFKYALDHSLGLQNTLVLCANGTAGTGVIIGLNKTGR